MEKTLTLKKAKKNAEKNVAKRFQNQKSSQKKSKRSVSRLQWPTVLTFAEKSRKIKTCRYSLDLAAWRKVSCNFI